MPHPGTKASFKLPPPALQVRLGEDTLGEMCLAALDVMYRLI